MFARLPDPVQALARKQFKLWRENPRHRSLKFKPLKEQYWSVRIDKGYRAVADWEGEVPVWFWIGSHDEYEKLIRRL